MKSFTFQDFQRLQFQNQVTVQKPTSPVGPIVLDDPKKLYYITYINASGAWDLDGTTSNKDEDKRAYKRHGNQSIQFFTPLCFNTVTINGADEVSFFWISAREF